jgi:hypothetical protein
VKKLVLIILALCLAFPLAGCARVGELQPVATREISYSNFNAIELGSRTRNFMVIGSTNIIPVELSVIKSESYRINLGANQNIFDFIQFSQSADLLKISIDDKKIANRDAVIKIEIAMPQMKSLKVNHANLRATVANVSESFNLTSPV